jgi:hypothetical protein
MTPEQTLDWLAQQHFDQCREDRPVQHWIRKMKSELPMKQTLPVQEPTTGNILMDSYNAMQSMKVEGPRHVVCQCDKCKAQPLQSGYRLVPLVPTDAMQVFVHKQAWINAVNAAPLPVQPMTGKGKEYSEQLKLCARNVAFVSAGYVNMSSAAMQEMFALIDHVCVGIDSPPQPEERNFCPRCGKRTADPTTIHTCTPPREST